MRAVFRDSPFSVYKEKMKNERRESYADTAVERRELLGQIAAMIDN